MLTHLEVLFELNFFKKTLNFTVDGHLQASVSPLELLQSPSRYAKMSLGLGHTLPFHVPVLHETEILLRKTLAVDVANV
jgi:hypothetical protein